MNNISVIEEIHNFDNFFEVNQLFRKSNENLERLTNKSGASRIFLRANGDVNSSINGFVVKIHNNAILLLDEGFNLHVADKNTSFKESSVCSSGDVEFAIRAYNILLNLIDTPSGSANFDIHLKCIIENYLRDSSVFVSELAAFYDHSAVLPQDKTRCKFVISKDVYILLGQFKDLLVTNKSTLCENTWFSYQEQNEAYSKFYHEYSDF